MLMKKQQKMAVAQEQMNKQIMAANDILEMIRKHNFRGSNFLTPEDIAQNRESIGPLITQGIMR